MFSKLSKFFRKVADSRIFVELRKTDVERFLEHSADIHDLERRIRIAETRGNNWGDTRYY